MEKTMIVRAADARVVENDWGKLTWYSSREIGNSEFLTTGECRIKPGCSNPLHSHPNCEEILTVVSGRIMHRIEGGEEVEMLPGDTISVPINLPHNARNVGEGEAVLSIAFTSADRQTKGE